MTSVNEGRIHHLPYSSGGGVIRDGPKKILINGIEYVNELLYVNSDTSKNIQVLGSGGEKEVPILGTLSLKDNYSTVC